MNKDRNEKLQIMVQTPIDIVVDYELNEVENYIDYYTPRNFVKLLNILLNNDLDVQFNFKRNKEDKSLVIVGDVDGEDLVDATIKWFELAPEYFEFEDIHIQYLNLQKDLKEEDWDLD